MVGAGTGGLVSAAIGAALGASVALVERNRMGGDCLNVGCVPSKGLLRASRSRAVGLSAGEAAERVVDVETFTVPLEEVDRARLNGDTDGFLRSCACT